jgi:triosephosphate isomerase (TIM)
MIPFLFVGNLKMNPVTEEEVLQYLTILKREAAGRERTLVQGVLCPTFLHLPLFTDLPSGFFVGAQHGFPEKSGAFTGEISFSQLRDYGVSHVLIGHSERRMYFGETSEMVRVRTEGALKYSLEPIVCMGETKEEREEGRTKSVLEKELHRLFSGLPKMQAEKIIVAYEPCWAIGSGVTPTTEEIAEAAEFIRQELRTLVGEETSQRIRLLYGGSVKAASLAEVSWEAGMQGVLVGGESLFAYEVVKMMNQAEEYFAVNIKEKVL